MTCEGRVLRRSDELKSCKVSDRSTVLVVRRTRGGGKHKDKKSKVEKKEIASSKRSEQRKGPAIQECDKDAVIWRLEEVG